ncbi:carotenoid oxygenase family protein [Mycolicibacter sinensis]|uniref:carotenoid oxygenase family protein n=1 Tax=Mycolicibacter sinensis (strain JDM601) TaxID=875328 RepID=UPI0022839809|nr:carotenoid oxygenase family protein [Mycolicibacter sinensis]
MDYEASRGTMVALVPRDGGKPLVRHTDPTLHLHLANAYEDRGDTVVELVDYDASWEDLNGQLSSVQTLAQSGTMPYGGHLTRMRITPSGSVTSERLTESYGEFPTFNLTRTGSPQRYTYLSANTGAGAYPNAVARIDNSTGRSSPTRCRRAGLHRAAPTPPAADIPRLLHPAGGARQVITAHAGRKPPRIY